MKREDAVSLLRELMGACPSFITVSSVSIVKEENEWGLNVTWAPDRSDENCLERIVANRGLKVIALGGRTFFRSGQKP